jgi:hypothetical protein
VALLFSLLAGMLVVGHMLFVAFAAFGAVLVLRRLWIAWLHVPSVLWAVFIEVTGGICPLTPLENVLRDRAGLDVYSSDFVARYLFPVLYPEGLTREVQVAIGIGVLAVNVVLYGSVIRRLIILRTRQAPPGGC